MPTRLSIVLPLGLVTAGCLTAATFAAPDKNTKPGPISSGGFESVELEGKPVPPISLTARSQDGDTVCDPGDLRVPAQTPIDLRVHNDADQIVTLASPELFAHGRLIRFDGPAGHAASELGFTIRPHTAARIVVRTPAEGSFSFTCALTGDQGKPFEGKLTASAPAR